MSKLAFYNAYHLGDCVFHLHFLRKLIPLLGTRVPIDFAVNPNYIPELKKHIADIDNIHLLSLPSFGDVDPLWINSHINAFGNYGEIFAAAGGDYAECYAKFFKQLCDKYNLPNPIRTKFDMLWDNPLSIEARLPHEFTGDIDYLIINAPCYSGQFLYNRDNFSCLFEKLLKKSVRIVCTHPTGTYNIPATLAYGLSLVDIARIATRSHRIIGIHTAPMIPCFNVWNIDKVFSWSLFSERETYSYNTRIDKYSTFQEFIEATEI